MMRVLGVVLFSCLALACGGGGSANDDGNPGGDGGPTGGDGGPTPDAFEPPAGYTRLIGRTWDLPGGATDTYRCVRATVTEDTYITNIIAQAPFGTHHTVLSISDGGTAGPDGVYNCNVAELGMVMLYASGVGTSPLDFPAGVGVKIPAGTQIHLNLHLFNATDNPISGDSAILVKSQSTPTAQLAEMVFAGTFSLAIQSNNQPTDFIGGCNASSNYKLFALWPHMHKLGRHSKFELTRNGNTMVLHDAAYDFAEQSYYLQTPEIQVQQGDQIKVTCTYVNNTGQTVTFGESSNQEMCFTGMYRYPAANAGLFQCTNIPNF